MIKPPAFFKNLKSETLTSLPILSSHWFMWEESEEQSGKVWEEGLMLEGRAVVTTQVQTWWYGIYLSARLL